MRRPETDLREIIEAVEIESASAFSITGDRFDTATNGATGDLTSRLANALYYRKYCRPTGGSASRTAPDSRASRIFVEKLSSANTGTGTWEPGWIVQRIEGDGTLVVRRQHDEFLVWARPDQFRSVNGAPAIDSPGRVRVAKELREMLQGYYTVFGNADRGDPLERLPTGVVRFYWHLTAQGAYPWIDELTQRFNAAGVAFHAKVLSDPAAYLRADSGVLYIERANVARAMQLLPALHKATVAGLRPSTPMFTKRLAHGLSVAEDPGDGRSFGQQRCQLIAEGLVHAFETGAHEAESRFKAVVDRFCDDGLSITKPWLNAGSQNKYRWGAGERI